MKVAQIVSTFPPYKAGIGNAAYNISWELAKLGHDVHVYTIKTRGDFNLDASLPFEVTRMRPFFKYGNAGFVPQLLWNLSGYDIVHLHYPFFGGAEMIYFRDSFAEMNVVVHYHMDVFGTGIMQRLFNWHSNYVMPRILEHANQILVTSMDYAQQSRVADMMTSKPDKFTEVPLGVNPELFRPRMKNRELLKKLKLENKEVILFVGALDRAHYFKGINYLIKAFQLISSNDNYRLLIVGDGNLRKSYESIATNFGLDRKVIFAGYVPDDLLPHYLNLADIFVLPSIDSSEAFGIAILEAMASGVPVIASDLPGVRSVVARKETGYLVKPKQVDVLAKQMLHLLKNPHIRNQFGQSGRDRILEQFTWERVGKQIDQVYNDTR